MVSLAGGCGSAESSTRSVGEGFAKPTSEAAVEAACSPRTPSTSGGLTAASSAEGATASNGAGVAALSSGPPVASGLSRGASAAGEASRLAGLSADAWWILFGPALSADSEEGSEINASTNSRIVDSTTGVVASPPD